MLLKRSIKNESVQSNYFPRGGIINISDEMMMHTRETRKRERERDVKERAKARNENLQCALIDACPASHDCMYFCRVSVCVCVECRASTYL